MPVGWVVNQCGEPETNADMALKFGMLVPLGSLETHGVFKGFGLTMMIDVLAGILPGANYGPTIPDWNNLKDNETMNLGHCFIVINPEVFAPGFQDRLECLVWFIRQMEPVSTRHVVQNSEQQLTLLKSRRFSLSRLVRVLKSALDKKGRGIQRDLHDRLEEGDYADDFYFLSHTWTEIGDKVKDLAEKPGRLS